MIKEKTKKKEDDPDKSHNLQYFDLDDLENSPVKSKKKK